MPSPDSGTPGGPALVVRGLAKRFGGQLALDDVSLTLLGGEVHGLLGENGSGKSTLIKILAGFHEPEDGAELEVRGKSVPLPLSPGQFRELGISFVHQDLGLILSLTVLDNLRLGEFAHASQRRISWRLERRKARTTFAEYGVKLDPDALVSSLRPVERALLAIVRAAAEIRAAVREHHGGVLVLDEPTVFLAKADKNDLFALVHEVASMGATVLFVSHDIDEVLEVTDRITVLRDGRNNGTVRTRDVAASHLIEMIIGRRLDVTTSKADLAPAARPVVASVRHLSAAGVRDISFEIHEREVLGLTGLVGSGFEEIPYLLFGARECDEGTLHLGAELHTLVSLTPATAIASGIALLPGDRQHEGSVGSLSVAENITMQVLNRYYRRLRLQTSQLRARSREMLDTYSVRPGIPTLPYTSLSGGNAQKALLAKWLETSPRLLLLHEPTQGVDIGSRLQIFRIIRKVADSGTVVICASSDYEQLAGICQRVLIVGRGRIMETLAGADITKGRIAERCYASL